MARHGENIRKRKDGRWEGRILKYNEKRGKHMYYSVYARTYDEVREKLAVQRYLMQNAKAESILEKTEKHPKSKDILLKNAVQEWLEEIKSSRKLSTYVKYKLFYQSHLEDNFQDVALTEITDALLQEKLFGAVSNNVFRSAHSMLNQILKFASQHYALPLHQLKNSLLAAPSKPIRVISKKDQKKLLSVLYHEMDIYKMAVLLGLFIGIRLGELCAIKWDDIDFENKTITISRTVQRLYVDGHTTKTMPVETAPKSRHSRREIPLTETVLELLVNLRNGKEYVFGGNKPMEPRTLQYHFKKILKEAMLANINFHALRHTFSTNCIENGTDVKSLSEMLGHHNVQITLNRYVHPSMDTKREYLDKLSIFYGQIRGQAV